MHLHNSSCYKMRCPSCTIKSAWLIIVDAIIVFYYIKINDILPLHCKRVLIHYLKKIVFKVFFVVIFFHENKTKRQNVMHADT